jgi:hypothetical protein
MDDYCMVVYHHRHAHSNANSVIVPPAANSRRDGKQLLYIAPDTFLHGISGVEEDTIIVNFWLDPGEDTNGDNRLDTLRDPFHVAFDAALAATSVTVAYIDDWETFSVKNGEVHCSSNEIRQLPTIDWWEY